MNIPMISKVLTSFLTNPQIYSRFGVNFSLGLLFSAAFYMQQSQINDLRQLLEPGEKLVKLQTNFEKVVREGIKSSSELPLWYEFKPQIENYYAYRDLEDFMGENSLFHGGPRDVFDNIYREVNEQRQIRSRQHSKYERDFRKYLKKAFESKELKANYNWDEAREAVKSHASYTALADFMENNPDITPEESCPQGIFESVRASFLLHQHASNSCSSSTSSADDTVCQVSDTERWKSKVESMKADITSNVEAMDALQTTSQHTSEISRYYYKRKSKRA